MPRKTLVKRTAVSNGYGHDLDELYTSLNEMLEEIYRLKPDLILGAGGDPEGLEWPGHSVSFNIAPSRTIFSLRAPVLIAPTGTMAANGAVTFGISLGPTYSGGIWAYFPAGAVFSGSAAGFYWTVMSSATAGIVYNTVDTAGTRMRPETLTPVVAAGPGAFTGVTTEITLAQFDVPDNLLQSGDSLSFRWSVGHSNSANTKTYRLKSGTNALFAPNHTTSDGWNNGADMYVDGPSSVAYPQGWIPMTDAAYNSVDILRGANKTVSFTAQRAVATDFVVLRGLRCVLFPVNP